MTLPIRSDRPVSIGVVVLTMGQRPAELNRALRTLLQQQNVTLDVVVVGNGWDPTCLPEGVRALHLPRNVGIPAGRNAGASEVTGEFILFLDDDSWLLSSTFLHDLARRLRADPELGMIQPRIVDPDRRGQEPGRWVPRIRKGDPATSSAAFSVAETAVMLPRFAFDSTGGWPASFFYAHEGIELAWRVWDNGYRVEYHGDLEVAHPVVSPTRHADYLRLNARNRVWLARRCLRWPFSWIYLANWTAIQVFRSRDLEELRLWFGGWRAGWREDPWLANEDRHRLSWRTMLRMARHGRPPII